MTLVNLNLKGIIPAMDIYNIKEMLLSKNPVSILYIERYIKLIGFAIANPVDENFYFEKHHILPRSMFPEYKDGRKFKWNIVKLSARQHFIAHWMLWRAFRNASMTYAFHCMCNVKGNNQKRYKCKSSKVFENLKIQYSEASSIIQKKRWEPEEARQERSIISKNIWTEDLRKAQSEKKKSEWRDPEFADNMSKRREEMWSDPNHIEKMNAIHSSPECREKKSKALKLYCSKPGIPEKKSKIMKEKFNCPDYKKIHQEYVCRFIYTITFSNNTVVETKSLKTFCKDSIYNETMMRNLLKGKIKVYKDVLVITKRDKGS